MFLGMSVCLMNKLLFRKMDHVIYVAQQIDSALFNKYPTPFMPLYITISHCFNMLHNIMLYRYIKSIYQTA